MKQHLVGLFGEHIRASRSPGLHEQEANAQGMKLHYKLFDFSELKKNKNDLGPMLDEVALNGFSGVNITHPFKRQVLEYLDVLSEEASAIGAVNTVVFREGKKIGYNTDCTGFLNAFQEEFADVSRGRVLLLGAGGAGSAVCEALMQASVKNLFIYDKELELARSLSEKLSHRYVEQNIYLLTSLDDEDLNVDGIVNASPVGMQQHPGLPLSKTLLHQQRWVSDIIYFPLKTELLVCAEKLGCRTMNGSKMAVYQAAEAFRLFTGVTADKNRMLQSF